MTRSRNKSIRRSSFERDAENTTLARFIRNLESRIYAQLSRQLVDNLFGENPATEGSFTLFDNIISWTSDGINITLNVNTLDGTTTTITIPVGFFYFLVVHVHKNTNYLV